MLFRQVYILGNNAEDSSLLCALGLTKLVKAGGTRMKMPFRIHLNSKSSTGKGIILFPRIKIFVLFCKALNRLL